jgi:outer membrane protein OmpA-like peptidoglycan-associated protein
LNSDTDADGLSDGDEVNKTNTEPLKADTDSDGLNDGDEVNRYKTNPLKSDTDGDTLTDGDEVNKYKSDPLKVDTDDDSLTDGDEVKNYRTNPTNRDTDNDKLTDGKEVKETRTDPLNPDTDGDRVIDGDDDCPHTPGEKSTIPGRNGCPLPPKIGTKTDFPDILFIVNTDEFNYEYPGTNSSLIKLLDYIKQCPGLQVIVEGHASAEGDAKRNQELSDMRAKRVRTWLIDQGANPGTIKSTIGYGSRMQKIKEPTGAALKKISAADLEAIRKQNRRMTIEVVRSCDYGK